jgi:hypothetical protein
MTTLSRTEHNEAVALFDWVRAHETHVPELRLFHAIPNGAKLSWGVNSQGYRYSREAGRLKNEGLRNGIADYCLPFPKSGYYGFYLELKANKYMPSLEQIFFLLYTRSLGYRSTCCWEADAAIQVIGNYLSGADVIENRVFYNVPDSRIGKLIELCMEAVEVYDLPADMTNVTLIDNHG